jgi:mannose-binding lectin 2
VKIHQARGLRGASIPTKARITYFQDKSLSVDLQYKPDYSWTPCIAVIATDDRPIKLPNVAYLGFSAETGELSDNHDILVVNSYSLYSQTPEGKGAGASRSQQTRSKDAVLTKGPDDSGSVLSFFFKLLLFVVLVGGSYVGWTIYRTSQRGSRF